MNHSQISAITFSILGLLGFCRTATASSEFDLCVMSQMQGQNIYMLPLAQKLCRDLLPPAPPPAPVETELTQEIEYNICSNQGDEELSICLTKPPTDKYITRVVGFFAMRNPCIITEQSYPTLYKTRLQRMSDDLYFVRAREPFFTSNKYTFGLKSSAYNCYRIEILGYRNCHASWAGGATCP